MKKYFNVVDAKDSFNNEITNYVHTTFNLDTQSILLVDATVSYLESKNTSYETYNSELLKEEIYIPCWIDDLIVILNSANIDLSVYELLREKILVDTKGE